MPKESNKAVNKIPSTILSRVPKVYIDNEILSTDIEVEAPLFEHLSFVSWNGTTLTVVILLAGNSSEGNSGIIQQNVVAYQYTQDMIVPSIKDKFSWVTSVRCFLSGDPNFDISVKIKCGCVENLDFWDESIIFADSMRYYGTIQPNV